MGDTQRMSWEAIASIAEAAAVVVGTIALIASLRGIRNELWLHTFTEYTARYSEILAELPPESGFPDSLFELEGLEPEERAESLRQLRRYFNLCSEELYLFTNKKIDEGTWKIWADGIKTAMTRPYFQGAWRHLRHDYQYFPDFLTFMDSFEESVHAPS